jgi:peroxiredoxin Q/BCP
MFSARVMLLPLFFSCLFFHLETSYAVSLGDKAPDFSLPGSDGKTHNLSDHLGKNIVVIAWFPRAFSPGCTMECKSFAEHGYLLDELGVAYFMASTDRLNRVVKFAKAMEAEFPILSDSKKEIAKAYSVLFFGIQSKRETHYIGKNGNIIYIDKNVSPETAAQDIAQRIVSLQSS